MGQSPQSGCRGYQRLHHALGPGLAAAASGHSGCAIEPTQKVNKVSTTDLSCHPLLPFHPLLPP